MPERDADREHQPAGVALRSPRGADDSDRREQDDHRDEPSQAYIDLVGRPGSAASDDREEQDRDAERDEPRIRATSGRAERRRARSHAAVERRSPSRLGA